MLQAYYMYIQCHSYSKTVSGGNKWDGIYITIVQSTLTLYQKSNSKKYCKIKHP